jgi:hypothetical protein
VPASAAATWAAVTDWERQSTWIPATTVRDVDGRIEAFTGFGRLGFLDVMEIEAWDPPRRCVVRHVGKIVRGTGVIEVEPRGESRSALTWTEWLDLPFGAAGRFGWRLARPVARWGLGVALRRFAATDLG